MVEEALHIKPRTFWLVCQGIVVACSSLVAIGIALAIVLGKADLTIPQWFGFVGLDLALIALIAFHSRSTLGWPIRVYSRSLDGPMEIHWLTKPVQLVATTEVIGYSTVRFEHMNDSPLGEDGLVLYLGGNKHIELSEFNLQSFDALVELLGRWQIPCLGSEGHLYAWSRRRYKFDK